MNCSTCLQSCPKIAGPPKWCPRGWRPGCADRPQHCVGRSCGHCRRTSWTIQLRNPLGWGRRRRKLCSLLGGTFRRYQCGHSRNAPGTFAQIHCNAWVYASLNLEAYLLNWQTRSPGPATTWPWARSTPNIHLRSISLLAVSNSCAPWISVGEPDFEPWHGKGLHQTGKLCYVKCNNSIVSFHVR